MKISTWNMLSNAQQWKKDGYVIDVKSKKHVCTQADEQYNKKIMQL